MRPSTTASTCDWGWRTVRATPADLLSLAIAGVLTLSGCTGSPPGPQHLPWQRVGTSDLTGHTPQLWEFKPDN